MKVISRTAYGAFLGVALYFVYNEIVLARSIDIPNEQYGELSSGFSSGTLLLTGDIMLGRVVEHVIDENDFEYLFSGISPLIRSHDVVVGNFEASVPEVHTATQPLAMRFSVRTEFMKDLHTTGFDILSLANNHSSDFGISGYKHTLNECTDASLICVGNSFTVSSSSLYVTSVGDVRVGIMFIHTLFNEPSEAELEPFLKALQEKSDVQIAYIHWGEEYQHKHSSSQEAFARMLIDNGFDAIVGHHPHVVQDIEEYQGKPIFYSLGNLIFDQYFNEAVQEGYLLSITPEKEFITYSLVPYTSSITPSQPQLMTDSNGVAFVRKILSSPFFTEDEIMARTFKVKRD